MGPRISTVQETVALFCISTDFSGSVSLDNVYWRYSSGLDSCVIGIFGTVDAHEEEEFTERLRR